jgi:hypothetical protein
MERFELNIVAQGPQSIWVAVIVIALICATVATVAIFRSRAKPGSKTQPASDAKGAYFRVHFSPTSSARPKHSMRTAARTARSQKRPKGA